MKIFKRLQISAVFAAVALVATAAIATDYTATITGTVPPRQMDSGDTVTVSGYSTSALEADGTSGGQPKGIIVTGGGGITAINLKSGAVGVVNSRNGGSIDLGTGSIIQAEGYGASAEIISATGLSAVTLNGAFRPSITAANLSIDAKSDRPIGVYATTDSSITLTGNTFIHTHANGTNGLGLFADDRGHLSVENATITMDGIDAAWGQNQGALWAQRDGQITATGTVAMTVAGNAALGLYTDAAGQITANNVTGTVTAKNDTSAWGSRSDSGIITVTGDMTHFHVQSDNGTAYGAAASENGQTLLQGSSDVTVSAKTALGLAINNGGTVSVNNGTWNVIGNTSAAAIQSWAVVPSNSTIQVSNSTLTSNLHGILVRGSAIALTLDRTTLVNNSGVFIDVRQNTIASALDMTAKNASQLSGTANVDETSTSNLTLESNTQWTMTGDSVVTGLTQDNSHILFSPPIESAFTTLTVIQNYTANNGSTIVMNSTLDDGAVPTTTDRLVIEGNTDGTVTLDIQNAGGSGALTAGDGIQIVQVQGVSDAVFTLAHPVIAGAYEYHLVKVGNGWFLQSQKGNLSATASVPALDSKGLTLLTGLLGLLAFTALRRFS
ncbi:MAG: hypothetical protein LBP90_04105 [Burkholderiales bacterium]|jgi:hypothetical protein|nr:hypothetical protein [Burkholderiales bacterium]